MPRTPTRRRITVAQAADRLSVSEKSIRRWIASGDLEAVRVGRKVLRLDPDDVDRLAVRVPTSGGVDDAALMVEKPPRDWPTTPQGMGGRLSRAAHHCARSAGRSSRSHERRRGDAGASNRRRQRSTERGRHQRHQRHPHRRTCTKTVTTPVRLASSVATPVRTKTSTFPQVTTFVTSVTCPRVPPLRTHHDRPRRHPPPHRRPR